MTWIENVQDYIVRSRCPGSFMQNAPACDTKTAVCDTDNNIIGCSGITCIDCWNQEASNDLD